MTYKRKDKVRALRDIQFAELGKIEAGTYGRVKYVTKGDSPYISVSFDGIEFTAAVFPRSIRNISRSP